MNTGYQNSLKKDLIKTFLIITIPAALMTLIVTEIILYSHNTLMVHPEWSSGKNLLVVPVMGGRRGLSTRNLLNRNRLNLNSWHSFNEILCNRIHQPGSVKFDFHLENGAYLNFLFNKKKNSFTGIRLSRNPGYPNIYFYSSPEGKYLTKGPLGKLSLNGCWHEAELKFQSNSLLLFIDGRIIQKLWTKSIEPQIIGFRSGKKAVIIDNVIIKDKQGKIILRETFRNKSGYLSILIVSFGIVSVFTLFFFIIGKLLKYDNKQKIFLIILVQLSSIVILISYYSFDYLYWSRLYHYRRGPMLIRSPLGRQLDPVEKARIRDFSVFTYFLADHAKKKKQNQQKLIDFLKLQGSLHYGRGDLKVIRNDVPKKVTIIDSNRDSVRAYMDKKPFSKGKRILFLGTSQTWGDGASKISDRIAYRVQNFLLNHIDPGENIYVINASKRGSISKKLLVRYQDHLFYFKPDLIIVNLSNNDWNSEELHKNLVSLIKLNRKAIGKHNPKFLFVLEANSTENSNKHLLMKHDVMVEVAKKYNIPCINLHGLFASPSVKGAGILWWDYVHMTSYGQEIAAKFITVAIIEKFDSFKRN